MAGRIARYVDVHAAVVMGVGLGRKQIRMKRRGAIGEAVKPFTQGLGMRGVGKRHPEGEAGAAVEHEDGLEASGVVEQRAQG